MITIVSVGKKHEDWVLPGIERYQKRLSSPFNLAWELLPHSSLSGGAARAEESERIMSKLDDRSFVVLLDETGTKLTSPDFTAQLERLFVGARKVVLIIGGAYGVSDKMLARADMVLSLSNMVLPHQLVRLVITEQLYRAQEISRGGRYHHQ